MSYWEIAVLAVVLAIDAFSVAAAAAPACCRRWGPLRLAGAFGIFQAGMPLLGALFGTWLVRRVGDYDHWVAFALLEVIGVKILIDAFVAGRGEKRRRESCPVDPSWSLALLGMAVATSIDAFGAGVALAARDASMWVAAPTIGLVCALLTLLGARLGSAAEKYLGRRAEVIGGLVLMALGVKMLF
ncbi:MAG: manganese efflux pump MntP [Planctomycetota bacterium]|jgi:putative Mn2+ efflux pump MntP